MARPGPTPPFPDLAPPDRSPASAIGEEVWIEVIQKMDEVYAKLLSYDAALEEKNAALEASQRFVVGVLTSMSDVLVVVNRAGLIEEVNPSLLRLTGRTEAGLKGTAVAGLFEGDLARQRADALFTSAAQPVQDEELPILAAEGGPVAVSLNATPRHDASGRLVGMVITGRPVGELRRAYHALRQAHEDLKRTQQQLLHAEKMASLGRLVAGVAHELNNPISFVLGNVHAMRRYAGRIQRYLAEVHAGADPGKLARLRTELRIDRLLEDLEPLLEGTIEGAERTRVIVDGLKRFSASDAHELAPLDLVEVVERAVRWVGGAAAGPQVVETTLPPRLPVVGSAGELQQVVMNLVENACDAVAGRAGARVEVAAWAAPPAAVVTVHDSGPGIAPVNLGRIFDPFFTTKPVGKGTGLGLSISYGIVERHHGTLTAANHPDGGAIFTLTLPLG